MYNNSFIVLRGPAGSGKSTIAQMLKEVLKEKTIIIEQDYFNHTLLSGLKDDTGLIAKIIERVSSLALAHGYSVVLEGVLRKEKYQHTIESISRKFNGRSVVCYLDISREETVRRHKTRDKYKMFDSDEMLSWYGLAGPIDASNEVIVDESLSKEEIVAAITRQLAKRDDNT